MKFTEEQRNKLRRSIESDFGCVCLDYTIDRIEQIISERITPEPKAMTEQEITNKEIYELECILEKVRKGGFMYTFAEAINDIENIFKPFMVQSAQITPEPGESGQSAEDVESIFYKLCDIARRDGASIEYLTKPNAIEAMRLHASQVCADKDREIDALNWAARMNRSDFLKAQSELDKANESLTVMVRKNAELDSAIQWALGGNGDFASRKEGEGAYWWRSELRKRSNL